MSEEKSVLESAVPKIVGLVLFLILLGIANIIQYNDFVYSQIVSFLNSELLMIIAFSMFLFLGDFFFIFDFPINLAAPMLGAIGGAILVDFIFDAIVEAGNLLYFSLSFLRAFEAFILIVVILAFLVVGYVKILSNIGYKKRKEKQKKTGKNSWMEIENKIKASFYPQKKFEYQMRPGPRPVSRKRVSRKKK